MSILGSRNVRCGNLHHRVRHNGSSAFMDRYTISFGLGVICFEQQIIVSCGRELSVSGKR